MPKPELEFFAPDHIPWQPVAGSTTGGAGGPGVEQKILALDEETGDVTRLLRFAAGVETKETITHDFWEEVWILSGELIDLGQGEDVHGRDVRVPPARHGPRALPCAPGLHDARAPVREGVVVTARSSALADPRA